MKYELYGDMKMTKIFLTISISIAPVIYIEAAIVVPR